MNSLPRTAMISVDASEYSGSYPSFRTLATSLRDRSFNGSRAARKTHRRAADVAAAPRTFNAHLCLVLRRRVESDEYKRFFGRNQG